MRIVPARPDDIPALLAIQAECGLSAWTAAGYGDEMHRSDSIIRIARNADNTIDGFVAGRASVLPESNHGDREGEIYNIGIRPALRRKGIGSLLLESFVLECSHRLVEKVWLEVRETNHTAIRFYTMHGFVAVTKRQNFYSAPVENAEIMVLRLQDPAGVTKT